MTPERYAAIKLALAKGNLTDEEAKAVLAHPQDSEPYRDIETFVQAVLDDMEDTFNLSDVRILYYSYLNKWIKAGRPDPNNPDNPIKPMSNTKIIAELKGYGLLYQERDSADPEPTLVTKRLAPPSSAKADLRSLGKTPRFT